MADDLQSLKKKRGIVKAKLSRFRTYLNGYETSPDLVQLKSRLERTEDVWREFDEVQTQVELLDEQENATDDRSAFEDSYFEAMATAKKIIANEQLIHEASSSSVHDASLPSGSSSGRSVASECKVRLPTLQLPDFDGSYHNWLSFRDTFISLIDQNQNLNDVQKFHYLKSCLKDNALKVLNSLEVSEANYAAAWELLKSRFENKKIIVDSHVKSLFEIPQVGKESHLSIRSLHDSLGQHLRALKSLDQPVDKWDTLIVHLISSKLDQASRREWEKHSLSLTDLATLVDLNKFLNNRCQFLERCTIEKVNENTAKGFTSNHKRAFNASRAYTHFASNSLQCVLCKGSHPLYSCETFRNLTPDKRFNEAKSLKICTNCLRQGHASRECQSRGCKHCNGRHNTMLHVYKNSAVRENPNPSSNLIDNRTTQNSKQGSNVTELRSMSTQIRKDVPSQVLLATASVSIVDSCGNLHQCRVLLDSGSQPNFITTRLVNKLKLSKQRSNVSVSGINLSCTSSTLKTSTVIKSNHNNYKLRLQCHILDQITDNLPCSAIDIAAMDIPDGVTLADPLFYEPNSIDLLIGAEAFWDLMCVGQIRLKDNLMMQKTKLGWIVSGPTGYPHIDRQVKTYFATCKDLCGQMERFWTVEEGDDTRAFSLEESECENHYVATTKCHEDGHFQVSLPFRDNVDKLGDSLPIAMKQFYSLERRLNNNRELKSQYVEFLREYESLGHMVKIEPSKVDNDGRHYYIPHHPVLKASSTTTKLRVVFNASQKTTTGISLNDTLKVGPVLQDDLLDVLLRFRTHNYVLIADVEKMYRQVRVSDQDSEFQRILWRENVNEPIQHFRLKTVTYGTSPGSFLAIRSLRQAAMDHEAQYPEASKAILSDFYVDDLMTGAHSIEVANKLVCDISHVLQTRGFKLRKWLSNNRSILKNINDESSNNVHQISKDESVKALGLSWNSVSDSLEYDIEIRQRDSSRATKRSVLSIISQIFDPLGLVSPIIVTAKMLMQSIWQIGIDWDESLPQDLATRWSRFYKEISAVRNIRIPRHVIPSDPVDIQLHGFSDASEKAYGACIYLRSRTSSGEVISNLLCSKSRVSPIKTISLPRLELCAALLLARLHSRVKKALGLTVSKTQFWSDSTITIAWIQMEPNRLKTFVANRVTELQQLTNPCDWRHISGEHNPADIVSRGASPSYLATSELWRHGPPWLVHDERSWPTQSDPLPAPPDEEIKVTATFVAKITDHDIFNKFSTLQKLQRVMAYCLRFLNNCKIANERFTGQLSSVEVTNALHVLCRIAQSTCFASELRDLQSKNVVSTVSTTRSLNPFMDQDRLIRVGGRLRKADMSYEQKHPILLPSNHPLTTLIVMHEHVRLLHSGPRGTLDSIRQRYWPIQGRGVVKRVLRRCMVCFKAEPKPLKYQMGDLPMSRITFARPFRVVGIDFAGPFMVKDGKLRNRQLVKSYICVFICFASKAIHLELVGDMSTNGFLNALKRFVSRRGLCHEIHCDNGTNFVGSQNQLQELAHILRNVDREPEVVSYFNDNQISWRFIPPRAPNFGGLWEAAVKSAKFHLKRIMGNAHLTFESFYTVFTQVEAVLNSRPLIPLSDDPNDLEAITPGHFLIGDKLTALPQLPLKDEPVNRLSDYQRLTQLLQHFWTRWKEEYLSQLQERYKWINKGANCIKPGTLVVIKEDNVPPLYWRMGRVEQVQPGEDNIVRVATVHTRSGLVKRAVTRICPLPIEDNESSTTN